MGARDTITDLKDQLEQAKQTLRLISVNHENARATVKSCEWNLADAKKRRNQLERDKAKMKKAVASLQNRIKDLPSRARRWGKDHPDEMLNTVTR